MFGLLNSRESGSESVQKGKNNFHVQLNVQVLGSPFRLSIQHAHGKPTSQLQGKASRALMSELKTMVKACDGCVKSTRIPVGWFFRLAESEHSLFIVVLLTCCLMQGLQLGGVHQKTKPKAFARIRVWMFTGVTHSQISCCDLSWQERLVTAIRETDSSERPEILRQALAKKYQGFQRGVVFKGFQKAPLCNLWCMQFSLDVLPCCKHSLKYFLKAFLRGVVRMSLN